MIEKTQNNNTEVSEGVLVVAQILFYIFAAIPLRLWYRAQRVFVSDTNSLTKGALIISNHQSMVDPFFVLACVPFRTFLKLLPIRFPTMDCIYVSPIYNPKFFPILKWLGCFTIGNTSTERMKAIFYIRTLLKRGRTVFLFPEGEIIKENNVKDLKQGIDFFIKDAPQVMFVRLYGLNGAYRDEHNRRRHKITFGEVFTPPPVMSVDEMQRYLENL